MRRTQLYLDDHLWNLLHAKARTRKTTVSELVREAIRERYLGKHEERLKAMRNFVGSRKNRRDEIASTEQVRILRRGTRMDRLQPE